jgi:predicted RNA-binding protein YlxR (DUF448 family)
MKKSKNQTKKQKIPDSTQIDNSPVYLDSSAHASLAINALHGHTLDSLSIMKILDKSADKINKGNINEIESMLMIQAKTLENIFYDALRKLSRTEMIPQLQVFADIAFRAQNQSRKTLMQLAEIKSPRRATFIKQQNNAINQQVNNDLESKTENSKNSEKLANELIPELNRETMDNRGTIQTISINPTTETLEPLNRPNNPRRKKYQQDECL